VTGEPTPLREEYEKMLAKLNENNDDSKEQTTSADSSNKTISSGSSAIVTTPADSGSSGKSSYSTIGDYDELIANATAGEAHALNRALFYLENYPYSEASLRDQLHILDSCSDKETEFALEHCKVDWNANALTKANKYLEFNPSISREILQSTLEYDQYTQSQITYALTRCNGSWNK
jgi:SOS response regulatory protein OraA/RecX